MTKPGELKGCTYVAKSANGLKGHKERHELKATFTCQYCPKMFKYRNSLENHEKLHRNEKPFQCEICQKRFIAESFLERHMKNSHSDKDFPCETCGKVEKNEESLKRHFSRYHGPSSNRRYPCKICKISFTELHSLRKHEESKTHQYYLNQSTINLE